MKITKYYITHIQYGISTIHLENGKRIEFDTWQEARKKVFDLETRNLIGFFAWKKETIDIEESHEN